jgi:hypothetical protein
VAPIIIRTISYSKESQIVTMHGREITIENHIPVLTDEEVLRQRSAIEERLYNIFEKYDDNHENKIAN